MKNAVAGLGLLSLNSLLQAEPRNKLIKRKIVCIGGHPDDPESGCGGTLARFAKAGHEVTIIYLTTGEAGIEGKSHKESAAIRRQEAINACKILQVKPVFAGQIDGDTIVSNDWLKKMQELVAAENPDIVFTHWPVDTHKDHQVASLLTMQVWNRSEKKFALYFFEVCAGFQTMIFHPTDFVDITETREIKSKSVYCHTSQNPANIYGADGHTAMEEFRGMQMGVKAAEAFVCMKGKVNGMMEIG